MSRTPLALTSAGSVGLGAQIGGSHDPNAVPTVTIALTATRVAEGRSGQERDDSHRGRELGRRRLRLVLFAAAFQPALSAGAPWAAAAYGGRAVQSDGRLPSRHRAASLITAVVLTAIGWLLLLRGGVMGSASENPALAVTCWVFAVLFGVNTLGNLTGRHPVERWSMGALSACLTVLCVLLAPG